MLLDHAELPNSNYIKLAMDKDIKRIVFCSGKIYYDLLEEREKLMENRVQLIRIEQLYPFPAKTLANHIKRFENVEKYFWCQEEPQNMGPWNTVERYLQWTLDFAGKKNNKIYYSGRNPSASTATGYLKKTPCSTERNHYKSSNYLNEYTSNCSNIRRVSCRGNSC